MVRAVLFVFLAFASCKVGVQRLTYARQDYSGREIRTDGYYFDIDTIFSKPLGKPSFQVLAHVKFFYRNGVVFDANIVFYDFVQLEKVLRDRVSMDVFKRTPYSWGIYLIKNRDLIIDGWSISTGGKHPSYVTRFSIENDSTLVEKEFSVKHRSTNGVYAFKQFASKPDSLNTFIK